MLTLREQRDKVLAHIDERPRYITALEIMAEELDRLGYAQHEEDD